MKWIGQDDELALSRVPSGGTSASGTCQALPLLVLPLLPVPLLEVRLLEVLPEVLAELPEVEVLPEVAEQSEVAGLWDAGLWKGLLQMKGGLTEMRLPVVTLLWKGEMAMLLGELWMVSMSGLLQMVSAWGLSGMVWIMGGATVAVLLGGMGAGSGLSRSMSSQSCKQKAEGILLVGQWQALGDLQGVSGLLLEVLQLLQWAC
jgi:hypothetical protein